MTSDGLKTPVAHFQESDSSNEDADTKTSSDGTKNDVSTQSKRKVLAELTHENLDMFNSMAYLQDDVEEAKSVPPALDVRPDAKRSPNVSRRSLSQKSPEIRPMSPEERKLANLERFNSGASVRRHQYHF